MQVTLIKLLGYREWTESLGSDREHLIQNVQGRLHTKISSSFSTYGAFAHPLRYDLMIAFTNGLGLEEHEKIIRDVESASPVPVIMSIATGQTPREAERRASLYCAKANSHPIHVNGEIPDNSEMCIIHADLVDSMSMLKTMSVYETYLKVQRTFIEFVRLVDRLDGIALYLGGDNMIGVTVPSRLDLGQIESFSTRFRVRVGVGVGVRAREALRKATEALDKLRREHTVAVEVIC